MTMENNNTLSENVIKPQFKRQTIILGSPENIKKSNYSILLTIMIAIISLGSMLYNNVDWTLVKEIPTLNRKIFKIQYFSKTTIPTVDSVIPIKISNTNKIGKKINNVLPNFHAYDELIQVKAKKYSVGVNVRPLTMKAIIEQESHYNPDVISYVPKWESMYGKLVKRKPGETPESWKLNFNSIGLAQIGYVLHKDFCELNSYTQLFIPEVNIDCLARLLAQCQKNTSESECIRKHNGSGPMAENYKKQVLGRMARIMSFQS